MRYDEFNKVQINNDYCGCEFGKTQKNEFSHFKGNPGSKDINNSNSSINDDREKNCHLKSAPKYDSEGKKETTSNSNETVKRVTEVTNASTSGAVGTAGAAASTGAVVVGGAAIVIGAVATVGALTSTVQMKHMSAEAHMVAYELELNRTDDFDFFLHLDNDTLEYHEVNELVDGINTGEFMDLTPETTYLLTVQSSEEQPRIIYTQKITTKEEYIEPAELISFVFDKTANYKDNSFDVSFTYNDPRDEMDNFSLTLTNVTGASRIYALEKTSEVQTLYGSSQSNNDLSIDFSLGETFTYKFAYDLKGEPVVYEEGQVTFGDNSGAKQEFRGITFFDEADFLQKVVYVQLDFDNDLNLLSDFVFTLKSDVNPDMRFNLELTTEKQALYIRNGILGANGGDEVNYQFEDASFSYSLSYKERGVEKLVSSEEPVMMEDISGAIQEFRSISFDTSADFLEKTFSVTLDMDNDYVHFSNFVLSMSSEDQPTLVFNLETSANKQLLKVSEATIQKTDPDQTMDFFTLSKEFTYTLSYLDKGEQTLYPHQDTVRFTDTSGAKQEFRGISIDDEANFLTRTIYVTLNMDNDFGYYSNFELTLSSAGQPSLVFSLDAVTTKQELKVADAEIITTSGQSMNDFTMHTTFYYKLTYVNKAETVVVNGQTGIEFTDISGAKQEFRSITVEQGADILDEIFYINIDMDNELSEFRNFYLELSCDDATIYFYPDIIAGRQAINVSDGYFYNSRPSNFSLDNDFSWEFSYQYNNAYKTVRSESSVHFVDSYNRVTEFTGVTFTGFTNMEQSTFDLTLDYVDDYSYLSNFVLTLWLDRGEGYVEEPEKFTFNLTKTTQKQTVSYEGVGLELGIEETYKYEVTVTHAKKGTLKVTGSTTFNYEYANFGANVSTKALKSQGNYYLPVELYLIDNVNAYTDTKITLTYTTQGGDINLVFTKTYDLEVVNDSYQFVNITDFLNEYKSGGGPVTDSATPEGYPYWVEGVQIKITTKCNGVIENIYEPQNVTIDLSGNVAGVEGGDITSTSISSSNPTLSFKVVGIVDPYTYSGAKLKFMFNDENESSYEYTLDIQELSAVDFVTSSYSLDLTTLTNYQELLTKLGNNKVTVMIEFTRSYGNSNDTIYLLYDKYIPVI